MGDAPAKDETHRITIEFEGPVDNEKFEAYKKELRALLNKVAGAKGPRPRIRHISLEKK